MAQKIARTPEFEGEALEELLEYINRPPNEEEKKIQKRIRNRRKVSFLNL